MTTTQSLDALHRALADALRLPDGTQPLLEPCPHKNELRWACRDCPNWTVEKPEVCGFCGSHAFELLPLPECCAGTGIRPRVFNGVYVLAEMAKAGYHYEVEAWEDEEAVTFLKNIPWESAPRIGRRKIEDPTDAASIDRAIREAAFEALQAQGAKPKEGSDG